MQTLLLVFMAGGLVQALLAIPLMLGKIPPNPIYGFRVKQTLENPAVWYLVNSYAGRQLFFAAIGILLFPALFYVLPGLGLDVYAIACGVVIMVFLTFAITRSMRFLKKVEVKKRGSVL